MNLSRPKDGIANTSESGRMRSHKDGGWIRKADYEAWRNYALALESKLRQATSSAPTPSSSKENAMNQKEAAENGFEEWHASRPDWMFTVGSPVFAAKSAWHARDAEVGKLREAVRERTVWCNLGGAPSGKACDYNSRDVHEIHGGGHGYIDEGGSQRWICDIHLIRKLEAKLAAVLNTEPTPSPLPAPQGEPTARSRMIQVREVWCNMCMAFRRTYNVHDAERCDNCHASLGPRHESSSASPVATEPAPAEPQTFTFVGGEGHRVTIRLEDAERRYSEYVRESEGFERFAEVMKTLVELDELALRCPIDGQEYDTALANARTSLDAVLNPNGAPVQTGEPK